MVGVIAVGLALLVGSLPCARLVERRWSIDLRSTGSGNLGAGNATRSGGLAAGLSLAVLDGLKGLIPVLIARRVGLSEPVIAATGLAAVAGNNWPVLRLDRGGRGLATSVGVIVGAVPGLVVWPGLLAVAGWKIGGGLGGLFGWGLLPVYAAWSSGNRTWIALALCLGVVMVIRRAQGNAGFQMAGLTRRVAFDDDSRPTTAPTRAIASQGRAGIGVTILVFVGFPLYIWATRSQAAGVVFDLWTFGLLAGAVVTELVAKLFFGELFREGALRAGIPMSMRTAFRAALVGTGVARLIPVGGAVTPLAMAWAAGDEGEGSAGAALRATMLNYGALSSATGVALIWVNVRFPPAGAPGTFMAIAVILLVLGVIVMGFGTRLNRLVPLVPARLRSRVENVLVDHDLTWRSGALLIGRVVFEASTLGLTLMAFGRSLPPSQVVAVFGASQLIGGLPGTPGGLGVTEAGLVGLLVMFGIPTAAVAGPVLVFRLISYWLPAIGGFAAGGRSYLQRRSRQLRV